MNEIQINDLVQLNPETVRNKAFTGCVMVVTELKPWGVQGYVQALGNDFETPGGQAFYRAKWEEIELVGYAKWIIK